jgi:hypothetical protein
VIKMPTEPPVVIEAAARCRKIRTGDSPAEGLPTQMRAAEAATEVGPAEAATEVNTAEAAAEVGPAEAATEVSAAQSATAKSTTAEVSAAEAAAAKAATHMPSATTATMECFSSCCPGESDTRDQDNHNLAQHRCMPPSDDQSIVWMTASIGPNIERELRSRPRTCVEVHGPMLGNVVTGF